MATCDDPDMTELRGSVVAKLADLAESAAYTDRADAGRALASFVDQRQAVDLLGRLLLDSEDTFVSQATARALLERYDEAGIVIVCRAFAVADDHTLQHLYDAVQAAFGLWGRELREAQETCEALVNSDDEGVRVGASILASDLATIHPVLRPLEPPRK